MVVLQTTALPLGYGSRSGRLFYSVAARIAIPREIGRAMSRSAYKRRRFNTLK
jgi:hypothetical protein